MKKQNKNWLLKGIGIVLLIAILLTWVTPIGEFTNGTFTKSEFSRVGIFDISNYSLLAFYYFTAVFGLLFVIAGFSKFLNSLKAFKKLTSNIAKRVEKFPFVFVVISMIFYAVLTSITKEALVMFLFVPVTVAIMAELKQTKIATFTASIGGILLGTLASTCNGNVTQIIKSVFTITKFNSEMIATIAIMVIGGVLLAILTLFASKKKDEELIVNELAEEFKAPEIKKVSTLPLTIIGVITSILTILAFIDWSNSFGVSFFSDLATKITDSTIGGVTVFKFIFGQNPIAFGEWTLFTLAGLLVLVTIILGIVYKVKLRDIVDQYIEGFKAYAKPIFIVFVLYTILITSVSFPTLGIVYDWIINVFGDNAFTWTVVTMIASVFNVTYEYVVGPLSGLFLNIGKETQEVVALATQFGYGLIQFVAPTSMSLALGLTLLDIDYKKYLKFIWKFFAAMTVISILVLVILTHIA
ncbi:MAG: hypothetical protein K6E99_01825 [Bacilli bacterium]|nr:hypothetical protein [Bacilli bacterium]